MTVTVDRFCWEAKEVSDSIRIDDGECEITLEDGVFEVRFDDDYCSHYGRFDINQIAALIAELQKSNKDKGKVEKSY